MKKVILLEKHTGMGFVCKGMTMDKTIAKQWRDFDETNSLTVVPVIRNNQDLIQILVDKGD